MTISVGEPIGPEDPQWADAAELFRETYGVYPWDLLSDVGWQVLRDDQGGVSLGFTRAGAVELQALVNNPGALADIDQAMAALDAIIRQLNDASHGEPNDRT